jgi:hypothetical protein
MQPTLLSDPECAPTILMPRPGGAVALYQGSNSVLLIPEEVDRLITVLGESRSTTPAKARLLRFPIGQQTSDHASDSS